MEPSRRRSSFPGQRLKGPAAAPGSAAFARLIWEARLCYSSSETSAHWSTCQLSAWWSSRTCLESLSPLSGRSSCCIIAGADWPEQEHRQRSCTCLLGSKYRPATWRRCWQALLGSCLGSSPRFCPQLPEKAVAAGHFQKPMTAGALSDSLDCLQHAWIAARPTWLAHRQFHACSRIFGSSNQYLKRRGY